MDVPDLAVAFERWRYQFQAADLRKYGSPHFDSRVAGSERRVNGVRDWPRPTPASIAAVPVKP